MKYKEMYLQEKSRADNLEHGIQTCRSYFKKMLTIQDTLQKEKRSKYVFWSDVLADCFHVSMRPLDNNDEKDICSLSRDVYASVLKDMREFMKDKDEQ